MADRFLPDLESPDEDPWLWLEDIDGDAAIKWVDAQNAETKTALENGAFVSDRDALATIFEREDRLPAIIRHQELIYNFWQDATHVRGIWRRTTLSSFRTEKPDWETVLDMDVLAETEGKDWVWKGPRRGHEDQKTIHIALSPGGGDAVVLREFDLVSKTFVENGFTLEAGKHWTSWWDADTLLITSPQGDDMASASGYGRTVRRWHRGVSFDNAETIFEVPPDHMAATAHVDRSTDKNRLILVDLIDFQRRAYTLVTSDGARTALNLPQKSTFEIRKNTALLALDEEWTSQGNRYPSGSLLCCEIDALLSDAPEWEILFTPKPDLALRDAFWNGEELVLSLLDDLKPRFDILTHDGGTWKKRSIDSLPDIGVAWISSFDATDTASGRELLIQSETPLSPPALDLLHPDGTVERLKSSSPAFDADGLVCTRHEAVSEDGTRVPYFQIGPQNQIDGNAPVHLYGYGGFQVSELPAYRSPIGKLWLEKGGTSVIACIRGGGEFGPDWHMAGVRENKHLSHDDFAAVAADLVNRGVTVPKRIAAEGGSNGGILITNMLARYPDRFGALFCTIPLIDMRRYSKLLAGASWIAEYGDPDKPNDWDFLQHISAYHTVSSYPNIASGDKPPIMIATTRRDDRVHPGHARKMTAKLQAMGHAARYFELDAGGHSYGKNAKERAAFTTMGLRFLRETIGWTD